uniref:RING-type domain-containing protein n=1 Tax=Anopheles dirus TaxID=7168 RepID=A0A182NQF7_9DIPT
MCATVDDVRLLDSSNTIMGDCVGHVGKNNNNINSNIVLPNGVILNHRPKSSAPATLNECLLCWNQPQDPSRCPSCARQYCLQCITKWFGTRRVQTPGGVECPNCHSKLPLENLVQCASEVDEQLTSACEPVQLTNGTAEVHNGSLKLSNGAATPVAETGTIRVVVKVLESDTNASPSDGHRSPPPRTTSRAGASNGAQTTMLTNGSGTEKMHPPITNGRQHGKRKDNLSSKSQLSNGAKTTADTVKTSADSAPAENGLNVPKPIICNGSHAETAAKSGHSNGKATVTFEEPKSTRRNGYRNKHTTDSAKLNSVDIEQPSPVEEQESKKVCEQTTATLPPADLPTHNGTTSETCPPVDVSTGSGDSLCPTHALPMLFFCLSCHGCICETCALHDDTHAEHTFKKITIVYDSKVEKIRHEFGGIKEYLADVGTVLRDIEQNIDWVRASKARKLQELSQLLHTEAENIERQIQAKLTLLQRQKDAVTAEIARVTGAYRRLESELKTCPKPELLFKDDDFVQRCSQLIQTPASKGFRHDHVPVDLDCEFVPEFRSEVFVIKNYHAIEPMEECRTSDVLRDVVGFGWRLHIWKSDHLSVTLIMTEGVIGRYEYCIELMHEDPAKAIRLTQIDHFELHQTGPVHDLIENEQLEVEGFLNPEEDSLQIKFSVRPPTIVMVSRYQQEFIDRFMKDNINEYDSNVITICNIRDPTTSIVLSKQYTDTVGSRWRLNVYPKGNNTSQRYLSTYVELCDGIAGRYQYTVELLHDDVTRQVKFQSEDHFQVGEIRGYQKFIRVRRLLEEGYLNEDGSILIRLSIRPANLALRCQYQEEYQTLKEEKLRTQFNTQLNQNLIRIKCLRDDNTSLQALVYPEYASNIFVVRNFTALREAQEDICSDNAYDDLGCCWRLIVYANGDKDGRDECLSVYLRLLEGIPGSYEYCVELLHNDAAKTVKMEGTQSFDIQERFGWPRFARLDWICANGFVSEEHDALYFRFSLRPPSYKAKCEYHHLLRLEAKRECELLKRELIPAYSTMTYTLRNFSEMLRKDSFVYSDPLVDDLGFSWRLLIYANGHNEARGNHISVYLILFEGVSARFEYRVELLHHRSPTANIKMEGVNVFKLKKIWGWPQFMDHERLQEEGYLDQATDTLEFRLSMCPPDVKVKCEYQQEFIRKLKENQK